MRRLWCGQVEKDQGEAQVHLLPKERLPRRLYQPAIKRWVKYKTMRSMISTLTKSYCTRMLHHVLSVRVFENHLSDAASTK